MKAESPSQWLQTYKDHKQSRQILTSVQVQTKQLKRSFHFKSFLKAEGEKKKKKNPEASQLSGEAAPAEGQLRTASA